MSRFWLITLPMDLKYMKTYKEIQRGNSSSKVMKLVHNGTNEA